MNKSIKSKILWQSVLVITSIALINLISSSLFFRLDLTTEKRYTLSENTKNLLTHLQNDISFDIYLEGDLNSGFKKLSKAIEELLDEFSVYGSNHILINFINPNEGTPNEIKAIKEELAKHQLSAQPVFEKTEDGRNTQSYVYPYAIVKISDLVVPINLLDNIKGFSGLENLNKSIENLEFKFTDAIRQILTTEKPKIAFIEGHGELDELDVVDITDQLSKYYQVERGKLGSNPHILDDYKAIIIAKPQQKFSESDKFIIDQYLMKGGNILWFVDAVNITLDSLRRAGETIGLLSDMNIDDQLFKYGIRINPVLIQDIQSGMIPITIQRSTGKNQIVPAPWLFNPLLIPQPEHPISKNMNVIEGEFSSSIDTVNSGLDLKRTVLLRTSRYTKTDQVPVFVSLSFVNEKPNRKVFNQSFLPVAIVQEGIFPSVFENRLIPDGINTNNLKIKYTSNPAKILVVADGDIIKNKVRFKDTNPQVLPLGYDDLTNQTFGNKDFILNAVNYLCDDEGWMNLRARNYQLRILDKSIIANESSKWKMINLLSPIVLLLLFAFTILTYRKIKYTK